MCIIEDICGYTEEVAYTIFFFLIIGQSGSEVVEGWVESLAGLCSQDSVLF